MKCLGFPEWHQCDKPAGCKRGAYWCEECNERRIEHINSCFARILEKFKACEEAVKMQSE